MSLATLKKGERFTELVGLIVKRVFPPKQGEAKNGEPGKLRQNLVLTDGTAEMGFTLWGADVGTVMEGDQLTIRNGWVNAYEGKQGEKLDLRLRKEGGWAKTGSGADIPQAPPLPAPKPEPQYVPVPTRAPAPSPAAQAVLNEVGAREANINKQSARRDAVAMCAAVEDGVSTDTVLELARHLYRWAMNLGPHWMADEDTRQRFRAKLGEAGLDSKDARRELRVYSMYDFEGTEQDALAIILGAAPPEAPRKPATAQSVAADRNDPGFATGPLRDAPAPTELISTANLKNLGELGMAVLANLKLNKTQALALVGVNEFIEVDGTTLQDKYNTIVCAVRDAA